MRLTGLVTGLALSLLPLHALAAPVLLISVDGLQPADVLDADKRGVDAPVLRGLMAAGAYATSVRNVLPTVTYPNHTTLITGASPARHGIASNTVFDPKGEREIWYWYASDIKTPTLWDAVHAAKQTVANIAWPASVGAHSIDHNIPEYWRDFDGDDVKLLRALSTPGLAAQLEDIASTSFEKLLSENPEGDEAKARYGVALIEAEHPRFMTLHFSSLDHLEHEYGPNTPETRAALHRIDADIGAVVAAGRRAAPDLIVAVVSDHGFVRVDHDVNLKKLFAEHHLLTLDPKGQRVVAWEAAPWPGGASAAVVLARPDDEALRARVAAVLTELQKRPELGIAKIIDRKEIAARGATPLAAFYIDFKLGYEGGLYAGAPLVGPSEIKGMHGYFPEHPEMHAAFIIAGPNLPRSGSLGEVDMRDIAPTLAKILKVSLPAAEGKPLF